MSDINTDVLDNLKMNRKFDGLLKSARHFWVFRYKFCILMNFSNFMWDFFFCCKSLYWNVFWTSPFLKGKSKHTEFPPGILGKYQRKFNIILWQGKGPYIPLNLVDKEVTPNCEFHHHIISIENMVT